MDGYAVLNGYAELYSAFAIGPVGDYAHTFIDAGLLPGVLAVAIRIRSRLPVISVVFRKRLLERRRWSKSMLLQTLALLSERAGVAELFCYVAGDGVGVPERADAVTLGVPEGGSAGPEAAAWAGSAVLAAVESVVAWRCRILISIGLPRAFRSRPYRRRSSLC